MLAFPLQYYLADSYGVVATARNQNAFSFIRGTKNFLGDYLAPSAIRENVLNINKLVENYVDQFEKSRKKTQRQNKNLYSGAGESPAHEVFSHMGGGQGYFAHSSKVRQRKLGD